MELVLTGEDLDMIALAGCTLEKVPGKQNFVDQGGGLPDFICRTAKAIVRSGKSVSSAIAIAVSKMRTWSVSGKGDTKSKAIKALAEWEALKAKSKGKTNLSGTSNNVLNLSAFKLDDVSTAYQHHWDVKRTEWNKAHRTGAAYESYISPNRYSYRYVKEVWSTFLIVKSDTGNDAALYKVPFKANKDGTFDFSEDIPVKQNYVVIKESAELSLDMSDEELLKLAVVPCSNKEQGSLAEMVELSQRMHNRSLDKRLESFGIVL